MSPKRRIKRSRYPFKVPGVAATYRHVASMHKTSLRTECGSLNRLQVGKLKAVTYAFPPRCEEIEEENKKVFISRDDVRFNKQ